MEIVNIDVSEIPKKLYIPKGNILAMLFEFCERSVKAGRVVLDPGKNPKSTVANIRVDIRNHKLPLNVCLRGKEIFLTRTDMEG